MFLCTQTPTDTLSEMSGGREDMKKTDSAQDHSECAEEARTMSAAISSTHQVDD